MGKLADYEYELMRGKDARIILSWEKCVAAVEREFECTLEEMMDWLPSRAASAARDVLAYIAFRYSPLSSSEISRRMGRGDHQTTILRKNRIRDRMKHVPEYKETIEAFVVEIQNDSGG